jgi:hypothetical protein
MTSSLWQSLAILMMRVSLVQSHDSDEASQKASRLSLVGIGIINADLGTIPFSNGLFETT